MNSKTKAHIAVLVGNFFFGSAAVSIKHLTPQLMQPLALNVMRVGIALMLFWLLFLFKPGNASIRKKDIPRFILCAAAGVSINQILFVQGASLTSPIHTSLLSLATPIAITIIAAWLLKEKITINKVVGLALGIGGAAVLILVKNHADKESSVSGDLLIISNAVSYAFYLVLAKPLMETYSPVHVIRWVFLFGAIMILPIGWKDFTQVNWNGFQWHHWFALVFLVIGATFLSYLFMVFGIAKLGSSITGTYIYTQPIFATIVSMVLYGEKLSLIKFVAAALIFGGVYLVNYKKKLSVSEGLESLD
ncbi:MAG: DMT family transporter [Chitinophagaceae bacterium]|nr:DMT family transporter [Chitinophagaceae bacterium]